MKSKNLDKKLPFLFFLVSYFLLLVCYAIFSYSLTSPNLVLSSNPTFWNFQTWMWQTFFENKELLSQTYLLLISLISLNYLGLIWGGKKLLTSLDNKIKIWHLIILVLFLLFPLLLSNNALSYDVFNYIFNAKMVLFYKTDPHVNVALDFAHDDWTRFMHNTHTAAPYGYGWTLFSLIPYTLGLGKFILTWLSFRVFSLISLLGLFFIFIGQKILKKDKSSIKINSLSLLLLAFNPLFLIEPISNFHNDLWMSASAIGALLLVANKFGQKQWWKVLLSLLLLGFSISVKFATLVILPIWIGLLIVNSPIKLPIIAKRIEGLLVRYWPLFASLLLFVPLFTARSQQFHPWYLLWSLPFIPLFGRTKIEKLWTGALITLSISSLFRYFPYLLAGNFEGSVLIQQKMITWSPLVLYLLSKVFIFTKTKTSSKSK